MFSVRTQIHMDTSTNSSAAASASTIIKKSDYYAAKLPVYHERSVKWDTIHHIITIEFNVSPKSLNLQNIKAWMQTVNVSFFRPT